MQLITSGALYPSQLYASSIGQVIPLGAYDRASVQLVYSNGTTAAFNFAPAAVNATADTITKVNHGQATGGKFQASSSGTLPGGLSTTTDYFFIVVDADTLKVASSLANAAAGTAIDLTSQGTGTHTFTPTTAAGNVAKLQASIDKVNWVDVTKVNFPNINLDATVTIATSAGSVLWSLGSPDFSYARVLYTPSAGQALMSIYVCGMG